MHAIILNMQISKNITKTKNLLNNADETYDIKITYDDSLVKSFAHVSAEIKNLFDNKKEKFYYKIEPLIKATYLLNNKTHTDKVKSCTLTYPTNLYKLNDIFIIISKKFCELQFYAELKILSINISIYYDYNKAKYDSDCD